MIYNGFGFVLGYRDWPTLNGVGSLESRGYCIFLPGAHYLTIYSPHGNDSSLNKLLLLIILLYLSVVILYTNCRTTCHTFITRLIYALPSLAIATNVNTFRTLHGISCQACRLTWLVSIRSNAASGVTTGMRLKPVA